MKKCFLIFSIFFSVVFSITTQAADLIEVYRQALCCDPTFKQILAQQFSNKQGVPISLSALLPAIVGTVNPTIVKNYVSGSNELNPLGNNTQKGYTINLSVTQTVFNFAQYFNLEQAMAISKQADATINAALQDLMIRVSKAYFAVLQDEDTVRYNEASKNAYKEQLDQVTQQFNVGLKTITDVYTAKASYDSSVAQYIAALNVLANDKENLRVITGVYYPTLSKLSERFPLMIPCPANIDTWACRAQFQNWQIKAAQYGADAACANVKQQAAGHLPTLQFQGGYGIIYNETIATDSTNIIPFSGSTHTSSYNAGLLLNVPIFQGGFVVASTRKAQYDYQAAFAKLDLQIRTVINNARQSYLGILSGRSKIEADRETIKSSTSSLEGMREGYKVGTQTLVDVLLIQQKVFQAYQQYAIDRYEYVNNLLALKLAAGTLSQCDLLAINAWLIDADGYAERKLQDIRRIPERIPPSKRHCWCKNEKSSSHSILAKQKNQSSTKLASKDTSKNSALTKNSSAKKLATQTKSKIITASHHKKHHHKNIHTVLKNSHKNNNHLV